MIAPDDEPTYANLKSNPNQRTPCVLVVDSSGSMSMPTPSNLTRIEELNRGLKAFEEALKSSDVASTRVQVAIVCVGGAAPEADLMMDFTDAHDFEAFDFIAGGFTPLGRGLELALNLVEQQKTAYKSHGVNYTRPWILVISDGEPTDNSGKLVRGTQAWRTIASQCREAELARHCTIYPICVGGADSATLQEISTTPIRLVDQTKFLELFVWLSNSMEAISRSAPGDTVQLPSTSPWEAVKL
jgi:uncharacterized protein YegL